MPKLTFVEGTATHAFNLAVFRIVLFSAMAAEALLPSNRAAWFASVPDELRSVPFGYSFLGLDPLSFPPPAGAWFLTAVFLLACAAAIAGFWTRPACWTASFLALYTLGFAHWYDAPNHLITHHHHLVWFGWILAASPCGDALSLDARAARLRGAPAAGVARDYRTPLTAVWILMGVIYFFPGLWKVARGMDWFSGEQLRFILLERGFKTGRGAPPSIFHGFHAFAATAVAAFELLFPFFVLPRRTRPFAAALGVSFHFLTWVFMRISFWPLAVCYVSFIDWHAMFRGGEKKEKSAASRSRRGFLALSAALVAVNVICGFGRVDSWPFGCYPSFDGHFSALLPSVRVEAAGRDVDQMKIARHYNEVRWYNLLSRIASEKDPEKTRERCRALWKLLVAEDPSLSGRLPVRFYAVKIPLEPSTGGERIREERLLFEVSGIA